MNFAFSRPICSDTFGCSGFKKGNSEHKIHEICAADFEINHMKLRERGERCVQHLDRHHTTSLTRLGRCSGQISYSDNVMSSRRMRRQIALRQTRSIRHRLSIRLWRVEIIYAHWSTDHCCCLENTVCSITLCISYWILASNYGVTLMSWYDLDDQEVTRT